MIAFYLIVGIFALGVLFWQLNLLIVSVFSTPIVYANGQAIRDAYKLADLKKRELVVDLGCGNAKSLIIAAKEFGAKGIGVDLSLYCYLKSKLNVTLAGQGKNIEIIWGGFKKSEPYLKKADVVYLYLLNSTLEKIEPWFFTSIGKYTKVVSLAFEFVDHQPINNSATINLGKKTKIRLYSK